VSVEPPPARADRIAEQLSDPRTWGEYGERLVEIDSTYGDGAAVAILVRKRGWRYELQDRGDAVSKARALGVGTEWLEAAERVVAAEGFNVNRRGVIYVGAVEGRDLAALALRLGECAHAVHSELLESALN
jgi:GNAT superfamily N-acetyltransferase